MKCIESDNAEDITVNYIESENTVSIDVWRDNLDISCLVINKHDAILLANKLLAITQDTDHASVK